MSTTRMPIHPESNLGRLLKADPKTGQRMVAWLNNGCPEDDPFAAEAKRLTDAFIEQMGE
jgi:hypothetical protein